MNLVRLIYQTYTDDPTIRLCPCPGSCPSISFASGGCVHRCLSQQGSTPPEGKQQQQRQPPNNQQQQGSLGIMSLKNFARHIRRWSHHGVVLCGKCLERQTRC